MSLAVKLILEILSLWVAFAIYMAIILGGKGPVNCIHFFPKEIQKRVVELGLIEEKAIKKKKRAAMYSGLTAMLILYYVIIICINRAESFWTIMWQFYVLFIGMELFDLFAVDIWWVALTSWWDIPGTEDLQYLYHDPKGRIKSKSGLLIAAIPVSAVVTGLFLLISGGRIWN